MQLTTIYTVRRNVMWFILVIGAVLLQMTCLDSIKIQEVKPSLSVLLIVYFAITEGEERAMFTGALAGLFQDVVGNMVLGHQVLANVLVGYIVARITRRLVTEHPAIKAGLVLAATMLQGIFYTAILYVQRPDISPVYLFLTNVVFQAFYTAVITPIIFFLLNRLFRQGDALKGVIS